MQEKKYQIFVSSTYTDLVDERMDAIETIIDKGHIPVGMEGFPAVDMEQFQYIKKVIDQCDYYLLIIGGRYGSLSGDGMSFTEMEYRYAVERGKIVIALVMDELAVEKLAPDKVEREPAIVDLLREFRADVMKGRVARKWIDRARLGRSVMKSLEYAFDNFPQEGWVRASSVANDLSSTQNDSLRSENVRLHETIEDLREQLKKEKGARATSLVARELIKKMDWSEVPIPAPPTPPPLEVVLMNSHGREVYNRANNPPSAWSIISTRISQALLSVQTKKSPEVLNQIFSKNLRQWYDEKLIEVANDPRIALEEEKVHFPENSNREVWRQRAKDCLAANGVLLAIKADVEQLAQ